MTETGAQYSLFDTRMGVFGVAWNERGLTRLQLPEATANATEARLRARTGSGEAANPPPVISDAIAAIRRYLEGEKVEFAAIDLDLAHADPFHARVYVLARQIGWGEISTYGELARRAAAPREAREVGQALARNPVAIIIPCHRILMKNMKIGGFSAYGGTLTKRRLLALEGVNLDEGMLPGLLPQSG
jgi:methylated-DNA-[protein]-cysteine S-methyltransferase